MVSFLAVVERLSCKAELHHVKYTGCEALPQQRSGFCCRDLLPGAGAGKAGLAKRGWLLWLVQVDTLQN